MNTSRHLNLGFVLGFAALAFALALNGYAYYRTNARLLANETAVDHSNAVLRNVQQLLSLVKDAETGQRGYLLTGEQGYLEPYLAAKDGISRQVGVLRDLVKDNPSQLRHLERASPILAAKIAELDETVKLRRDSGEDAARRIVKTDRGKLLMDQFREILGSTTQEELVTLASRAKSSRQSHLGANITVLLATALGLGLVGLVFWTTNRQYYLIARQAADLTVSEASFRALAETLPQIVFTARPDGHLDYYNDRWYEFTGFARSGSAENSWTAILHPQDVDRSLKTWDQSVRSESPFEIEYRFRDRANDSYRWFLGRALPLRDASGKVLKWFGTCTDIDHLKQIQEKLRQSEQRFRAATQAVSDILWTNNGVGQMVGEQSGWATFTGQSFQEYQGYGWAQAVHPEDAQGTIDAWNKAVVEKRIFEWEHRVRGNEGNYRLFSIRAIPSLAPDGTILEWIGVHTDITDRKAAEEALLQSEKLSSVGRMAATMAHEINNPLEAVVNLLYLVQSDKTLSDRNRAKLELAEQELARVTHITKQTLGFYRETGGAVPVSISDIVDSLLTLYAPKFRAKGVIVDREYVGSSTVEAIPGEIRQVISNFLTNALDAVHAKGRIIVRISDRQAANGGSRAGVRISVADNGAGILHKNIKRLFEPFFTTKKDVGTGLGLFVSKQIVEKHGGLIKVRSQIHRGTVVSVVLPASSKPGA